jgi:hypothetical protein
MKVDILPSFHMSITFLWYWTELLAFGSIFWWNQFLFLICLTDCKSLYTPHALFVHFAVSVHNVGTIDCSNECRCFSMNLLQFIGLKIAGYHHAQPGSAKILGFFATRDQIEPLRNYVYRRETDNYEAVTVKPNMVFKKKTCKLLHVCLFYCSEDTYAWDCSIIIKLYK